MMQVTVYTDGACRGNPGPGGYGSILQYRGPDQQLYEKELSGGYQSTTNNRMEILAAVTALEALKKPCQVVVYSDSQYLVNAFQQGWLIKWKKQNWFRDAKKKEPVKNVDLWKRLDALLQIHEVTFHWVKGHAENPYNNRCDELAVSAALEKDKWQIDEGFIENL